MLLGYVAGKRNQFTQCQAAGFNKLVLNYALPLALFVSIAKSTREELFSDVRTLLLSVVVLIGWYFIALVIAMKFFKHDKREAGLAALSASSPTAGFLGYAVLSPLFHGQAALPIAIVALVVNAMQVPLAIFFIAPEGTKPSAALTNALKQPVVLGPLVAVLLVVIGIRFPPIADPPLLLIGNTTSGIAVFAAGLVLSAHHFSVDREVVWNTFVKLLVVPACMLGGAILLGIHGEKLEQLVLLATLPPAMSGIVIAGRYQVYVSLAASSLIVATFVFAVAAPVWIWFVRYVVH